MGPSYLTDKLHRLGSRMVGIGWISAIGWGALAALAFLIAAVWVDLVWELPAGVRAGCWWMAILVGLGLLGWLVTIAYRYRSPHLLAQRIDVLAGTGGQIRTAVDLLEMRERQPDLTAGLSRLAIGRCGAIVDKIADSQVVPARPIRRSFGSVILLLALVLVSFLIAPRLAWTQWRRFTQPYDDYAPYSRLTFHVDPGHVKVVFGTSLEIRVRSEGGAVERVELLLASDRGTPEELLPMFPEAEGQWRALISSVTTPGHYYVRARNARSERFRIDVLTVPKIENVRFRITPPAYTNLATYEGPAPQGGIVGLASTKVEVWARSNRPLAGGTLDVQTKRDLAQMTMQPTAEGSQEVHGSFELDDSGKMSLRVIDVENQKSTDEITIPITLLLDERPFIRLLEPKELSFATPNVTLPVVVAAEDDYGIASVQLFRSLNDSRALPMDVKVPRPSPTRWQEVVPLPLSTYGLSPGDEIKLFARVEDNDPAGAKGSESNVVVVRIIAQEDYDRMLRRQQGMEVLLSKYQQAERRLETIAEEMEKVQKELENLPPDSELAKEQQKLLEELASQMEKEAEAMRETAKHDLPYDIDQALKQHLEELAKQVEEAAKEVREAGEPSPGMPKPTNREAAKQLAKQREKLAGAKKKYQEQAEQPLEDFSKIYPLYEDMARFVDLYQRQKSLAERMQSLEGKDQVDDPKAKARMRDLQNEQMELREALAKLLEDIEAHAAQLPDHPDVDKLRETAQQFCKDVGASGAEETMQDAEFRLGEFSGTKAFQSAREAEQILEKFISRCNGENGMANQCKSCMAFSPSLSSCVGDSLDQMLGDAGMSMGEGMGQGEGAGRDGYSARRNTMNNVGLYGNSPLMSSSSQRGGSSGQQGNLPGGRNTARPDRANPNAADAARQRKVGGAADAAIPPSYRRKVAEYFQRIAEEWGSKLAYGGFGGSLSFFGTSPSFFGVSSAAFGGSFGSGLVTGSDGLAMSWKGARGVGSAVFVGSGGGFPDPGAEVHAAAAGDQHGAESTITEPFRRDTHRHPLTLRR